MSTSNELLTELADHLEAAARTIRTLATIAPGDVIREPAAPEGESSADLDPETWVTLARELHPALGERQAQVLGEVAKAHPDGTGTGPIWRAIGYEQTNTYLTLDALARQGLVRKDSTTKPHRYFLGPALLRHATGQHR